MIEYPDIDPVAISIGPISIHWYALSYMAGIGLVWWLVGLRARRLRLDWDGEQISDLIFYGALGVILGGRIGYVFFYSFSEFLDNPLMLLRIWEGGMSFHGGMIGVFAAMYVYARWHNRTFFQIADLAAPAIPIALGCGRLGNFANTELPGRPSDVPWALVYPGEDFARHPSSLYQFALEGVVLFAICWIYGARRRPTMAVSGMFLMAYGMLRMLSEQFREPDAHIGFIAFDWLTLGQLLSLPMVLFGAGLIAWAYANASASPGQEKGTRQTS